MSVKPQPTSPAMPASSADVRSGSTLTEDLRGDGIAADPLVVATPVPEKMASNKIQCDACPVLCQISAGRLGACDRWGNVDGLLKRMDTVLLMQRAGQPLVTQTALTDGAASVDSAVADAAAGGALADTGARDAADRVHAWDGSLLNSSPLFVTAVGSGTTYPDYKPAPFIVSSRHEGVDMVTVVTEGIFSYCSFKVKIDTDRYLGPEQATVRHQGEAVGHVTTIEYGSQFLSLGGVHHLTGGSKKEGRVTCELMEALGNQQRVELEVEGGARIEVQAGQPPVINGVPESRMRVGCGSATIGIFAKQWFGHVDEVVVVDDHITGVLSEHQAGRCLDMTPSGIRIRGRKSTPGRYFQVANPGTGWGGTDIANPLSIIEGWDKKVARPGMRLLMVSTTGEHSAYFELDEKLVPCAVAMPPALQQTVERIGENCEPALATVLFLGGAGGSLRAGVTDNPVRLTQSIKRLLTRVTCGGVPAYVWPGGGITVMVDVARMPANSFGTVPTPAIVAPIEFTLRLDDYQALGGHMDRVQTIEQVLREASPRFMTWPSAMPWPHSAVLAGVGYE